MKPALAALLTGSLAASLSSAASAQAPQVLTVPDFGDFLVVDGPGVWMTNRGRVEHWTREGLVASVALARPCGAMAITGGNLWVADCTAGAIHRIDTATATRTLTVETGIADKSGELNVVAGAGSVWVASAAAGEVARVDPASGQIVARIKADPGTSYLAFGHDALWAVSAATQTLLRIDPATNRVTQRTLLGRQPGFLAAGEGAVWVQEQGEGTLARIDPATGAVTGLVKVGANLKYGDIDTGAGRVWLRTTDDQEYVAIDAATLAILARVGKPVGSGAIRFTPEGVWTSAHDVKTLIWWPAPALGPTRGAGRRAAH
ncbi:Vgb family protein [Sandarakinorhabdus rubra]|uniref:Vgb family protein n=1 Tax=Sandarakinorhabdus rubra TaxID=2672568 RepID=UPI0013DC0DE6|nr:YncE family protein [Sandarakinorhabdus rubra]